MDASLEQTNSTAQFDPSLMPVIPLSSAAISGLISALLWYGNSTLNVCSIIFLPSPFAFRVKQTLAHRHPAVSLRAWCLALQTLTLASNEAMPNDEIDASISTPLDGLLGGMASSVVKDRNMGPMFLRLLSGNGLNVESRDKEYMTVSFFSILAIRNLDKRNLVGFSKIHNLLFLYSKNSEECHELFQNKGEILTRRICFFGSLISRLFAFFKLCMQNQN